MAGQPPPFDMSYFAKDGLPLWDGSRFVPLRRPSASSILTHSGSPGGLAWSAKNTAISHTVLDAAAHTDTVAQTVSRGSLVYGNSTPKWDELVVGSANTVLRSDGTDVSWGAIDHNYLTNRGSWPLDIVPAGEIGNDREWIILAGTPDFAQRNSIYGATAFDQTTDEAVQWLRSLFVPPNFVSWQDILLIWTNLGAGSGNVVWRVGYSGIGDTGTMPSLTTTDTTIAAPAQHILKMSVLSIAPTAASGYLFNFSVARLASSGSDTLANDAGFLALVPRITVDM